MAKGRKRKDSADEKVEAYRHETETRKNVVPVGLASYDTSTSKPKKFGYDLHLVWTGKTENTSFKVPTVSLYIHERIAPEAIIRSIKQETIQLDLFVKLCNHSVKRGGSQKWRTLRQAQGDITRRIAGLSW